MYNWKWIIYCIGQISSPRNGEAVEKAVEVLWDCNIHHSPKRNTRATTIDDSRL